MEDITTRLIRLGWNQRVLTLDDFYEECARDRIIVRRVRLFVKGRYLIQRGQPIILLDRGLRGWELNMVAWHEYGHAILHSPGAFGLQTKVEKQADRIALCALMPALVLHFSNWEIYEMFGYPLDLIEERAELFRTRGI